MDDNSLFPVFSKRKIDERLTELAAGIDSVYGQEPLVAVCVLKGAFMFFSDLTRLLHNPNIELDFVRLASYGMNSVSSKHIIFNKDVEIDIRDKHVLVVEDIVDSGHTMRFLLDQFAARKPSSLRLAALLDKFERREASVKVDFAGFAVPDGFLVGYGLDYGERYRNLPDIFELRPEKRF